MQKVYSLTGKRVVITGGAGFLGKAVTREVEARNPAEIIIPRSASYDLVDAQAVRQLYADAKPDVVLHLAAQVGGIGANREHPGRFFYANLMMGVNLIEEGRKAGLGRFVQVGTICSYPKFTPVPFKEEELWNGFPEETNAPYGIAKKALLVQLQAYQAEY
ncbi:MAG: NAD-dependent epimerase/dehydratase family protein, partial [Planctomycetes bacterium]|nr:NAD-dependent epimerase/dehydratase family protein [Planctomycetota bacterium]